MKNIICLFISRYKWWRIVRKLTNTPFYKRMRKLSPEEQKRRQDQMAADFACFTNLPIEDVMRKLEDSLSGKVNPLE